MALDHKNGFHGAKSALASSDNMWSRWMSGSAKRSTLAYPIPTVSLSTPLLTNCFQFMDIVCGVLNAIYIGKIEFIHI
jgi:hypothetical protein